MAWESIGEEFDIELTSQPPLRKDIFFQTWINMFYSLPPISVFIFLPNIAYQISEYGNKQNLN